MGISCATNALRTLQNFVFLDKPMRIAYCKSKSDVVSLEDGTYRPRAADGTKKEEEVKAKAQGGPKPKKPNTGEAKDSKMPGVVPKFMPHPGAGPEKKDGEG